MQNNNIIYINNFNNFNNEDIYKILINYLDIDKIDIEKTFQEFRNLSDKYSFINDNLNMLVFLYYGFISKLMLDYKNNIRNNLNIQTSIDHFLYKYIKQKDNKLILKFKSQNYLIYYTGYKINNLDNYNISLNLNCENSYFWNCKPFIKNDYLMIFIQYNGNADDILGNIHMKDYLILDGNENLEISLSKKEDINLENILYI